MKSLTQEQLLGIENKLTIIYGISDKALRDELIDDLACTIEDLLSQGYSYTQATEQVFEQWHKNLLPHPILSYGDVTWFIAKKWLLKDVKLFLLALVMAYTTFYLSHYVAMASYYEVMITYGISFLTLGISAATFFNLKKSTNYRIIYLRKKSQSLGLIALFNFLFLIMPKQYLGFAPLLLSFLFLQLLIVKETLQLNNLYQQSHETTR